MFYRHHVEVRMARKWMLLGLGLWLAATAGCGTPTDEWPPNDLEATLPSPPNGEGGGGGEAEPTPTPMQLQRTRIGIDRQNMAGPPGAWQVSLETGQAAYTVEGTTVRYTWSVPPVLITGPVTLTYQTTVTAPTGGRGIGEILISSTGMRSVPNQVRQAEAVAENGATTSGQQSIQVSPNNEKWPEDTATLSVHLRFGPRIIYTYTYGDLGASPTPSETPGP
jgi:hypothetical protein